MNLTHKHNGKRVFVNPVNIVTVDEEEDGSFIKTTSGLNVSVKESFEVVLDKIYPSPSIVQCDDVKNGDI